MREILAATFFVLWSSGVCHCQDGVIPPAEMTTTSPQEAMQTVSKLLQNADEKERSRTSHHFNQLGAASRLGASNVFLVDATNIHDAIRASASVFGGSRTADTPAPVNQSRPQRGSHWLVAYLGTSHSTPVRWVVRDVAVADKKIRLTYREPTVQISTRDLVPYFYWIPLGKLDPGVYQLELYDAEQKLVSLMRRVKVAESQ